MVKLYKPVLLQCALQAVLILITCSNGYAQPKVNQPVPEIRLVDTSGNMVALSSLKGKVVLIDFWASWCVPCRKSNPALVKIYNSYRSKGFEIYGISLDQSPTAWRRAIEADGLTWVQVNDNNGWEASVTMEWKVDFIPASFLVSREGVLVAVDPNHRRLRTYLKKRLK